MYSKNKTSLILFVIVCYSNVFSQTQKTVTFKPDSVRGQDAAIWTTGNCLPTGYTQLPVNMNLGNVDNIGPASWTHSSQGCPSGTFRHLLRFDELSTIPASAVIIKAKLKLYGTYPADVGITNTCYPGSPYASYCPNTSFLQRITSTWDEQTVTWNTQPSVDTTNQITIPQSTSLWNCDFADSSANLVSIVQDWVSNPTTNFGWMMRLETEAYYRASKFASSDYPDSALHPELTVTYLDCLADTTKFDAVICKGDTYQENGFSDSVSGIYTQNLQNSSDCDSLVVLNLTVKLFDSLTIYDSTCPNTAYTSPFFNIPASELQTAGDFEFKDTISSTTGGCDTVIILTLNVLDKDTVRIPATICEGETYQENGFNVSDSGTHIQTLQNRFGCDSTVILNLHVAAKDTVSIFAEICDGETYSQNGFNVSKSGIYTQNLQNYAGCDSLVELNLTVKPMPDIEIIAISDNFCDKDFVEIQLITNGDSFLWSTGSSENPITVTKSGIYSATAFIKACEKTAEYIVEECPCELWLPNAFTPNNDGVNDSFFPIIHSNLVSFSMHIYDRWGQIIYKTDSYTPWDGTCNGRYAVAGVYFCVISYSCANKPSKIYTKQGSITLFR